MYNQVGQCHLCGKTKPLKRDHVHDDGGRIRGMLCVSCNTGLGKLGDDEAGILKALAYVQASPIGPVWQQARETDRAKSNERARRWRARHAEEVREYQREYKRRIRGSVMAS